MHSCIFARIQTVFCTDKIDVRKWIACRCKFNDARIPVDTFIRILCRIRGKEAFSLGNITMVMWVLGVGLSWGEWWWRRGALLLLFWRNPPPSRSTLPTSFKSKVTSVFSDERILHFHNPPQNTRPGAILQPSRWLKMCSMLARQTRSERSWQHLLKTHQVKVHQARSKSA